ncbi:hypothetical protein SUGI_0594650 [Cryptomeria japonica]|nr:hypothetical protein SUGI_0594650 [Cryptomeria japonica]
MDIRVFNSRAGRMMAPFHSAYQGNNFDTRARDYYKIMEIDYTGYLIVDSTSLKTTLCQNNTTIVVFSLLPQPNLFIISMFNKFVIIGYHMVDTYAYGGWGEARCVSTCYPQSDPPYCRDGCWKANFTTAITAIW